jgi:hypothetical protein
MIFSDLPSPAEASGQNDRPCQGFAQAGNRFPLFGIMLYSWSMIFSENRFPLFGIMLSPILAASGRAGS